MATAATIDRLFSQYLSSQFPQLVNAKTQTSLAMVQALKTGFIAGYYANKAGV